MKKRIFAVACAALLLTACGAKSESASGSASDSTFEAESSDIITDDVFEAASFESAQSSDGAFSEYTLELKGAKENYMAIIRRGEFDDEISVTLEDNQYRSSSFVITAPSGYEPFFPYTQAQASTIVNVISNDITDDYIPDIIQFSFYVTQEEIDKGSDLSYSVSRMYTIDENGELREITIKADDSEGADTEEDISDILDQVHLYHTEPDKFIYEMVVDDTNVYDENGELKPIGDCVTLKTLTFDYSVPCFVAGEAEISEDNPLYFGYAYWAAANTEAQYFIMTTFNITDWENYVERTNDATGGSEYYFKIDDSRFKSVDDLLPYLENVFSAGTAERIFNDAPQKYCDIDGSLYGIAGDGGMDFTLGTLTFTDVEVSSDRMIFRSRQEKYTEDGDPAGYTDGGNFVITKQSDGSWRVSQYRYPYSNN